MVHRESPYISSTVIEERAIALQQELRELDRLRSQRHELLKSPSQHWLDYAEASSLEFHGATLDALAEKEKEIVREENALRVEEDSVRAILDDLEKSEVTFRQLDEHLSALAAERKGPQAYYIEPTSYHGEIVREHRRIRDDIANYEARLLTLLRRKATAERLRGEASVLRKEMEESYRRGLSLSRQLGSDGDELTKEAKLYVTVLEGRHLDQFFGHSGIDPYVVLSIGSNPVQSGRTRSFRGKTSPKFNDSFEFSIQPSMSALAVGVWHLRGTQQNEFLGGFSVTLSSLEDWRDHDCWYEVPARGVNTPDAKLSRVSERSPIDAQVPQIRLRLKYSNPERKKALEMDRRRQAEAEFRRHQVEHQSSPNAASAAWADRQSPAVEQLSGTFRSENGITYVDYPGRGSSPAPVRDVSATRPGNSYSDQYPALVPPALAGGASDPAMRGNLRGPAPEPSASYLGHTYDDEDIRRKELEMEIVALRKQLEAQEREAALLKEAHGIRDELERARMLKEAMDSGGDAKPKDASPATMDNTARRMRRFSARSFEPYPVQYPHEHNRLPQLSSQGTSEERLRPPSSGRSPSPDRAPSPSPPATRPPSAPPSDDTDTGAGVGPADDPPLEGYTDTSSNKAKRAKTPEVLPPTNNYEESRPASKTIVMSPETRGATRQGEAAPVASSSQQGSDPKTSLEEQVRQRRNAGMQVGTHVGEVEGGRIVRRLVVSLSADSQWIVTYVMLDNAPMPRTKLGQSIHTIKVSDLLKVEPTHSMSTKANKSSSGGLLAMLGLGKSKANNNKDLDTANLAMSITITHKAHKRPLILCLFEREDYDLWLKGLRFLLRGTDESDPNTQQQQPIRRTSTGNVRTGSAGNVRSGSTRNRTPPADHSTSSPQPDDPRAGNKQRPVASGSGTRPGSRTSVTGTAPQNSKKAKKVKPAAKPISVRSATGGVTGGQRRPTAAELARRPSGNR